MLVKAELKIIGSSMSQIQIAVVDDDPIMHGLLRDFLTRQGYKISNVNSATEALALFLSSTPTNPAPDLVLSDVKMSPLNGIELTKQLLASRPLLPVILFSVYESSELDTEALKAGARRLLKKPFPLAELANAIKAELGKKV